MANEHATAQALPTELHLGRFYDAVDCFHDTSDELVGVIQEIETDIDYRTELGEPEAQVWPRLEQKLRTSHRSFLRVSQLGFAAVLRQRIPTSEKADMLATLFEYPLTSYAYLEGHPETGMGSKRPDNEDPEWLERQAKNLRTHRRTADIICNEVLDKHIVTSVGDIPYPASVTANVLTGILNNRIREITLNNLQIELPEDVPMLPPSRLRAAMNIGLVIGAAGLAGLAVSKVQPLKLAKKFLPKSLV